MIQFLMNSMLLIFTILFMNLKHPLAMGFLLLIQTVLISLSTGLMFESFWFSYILFLVFLGGMLVLFIYVTSLASNEMFNFSLKLLCISVFLFILLMLIMTKINIMENSLLVNNENNMNIYNMMETENKISIYKIYNFSMNWITYLLINYLFFTLIVTVKITNFFYGPLRNLN